MESTFYTWLDSIIPGAGLLLAIIIVGGGLIIGGYRFLKKTNDSYKKSILEKEQEKQEYYELKDVISDISAKMTSICDQVERLERDNSMSIGRINDQIEELSSLINQEKQESIVGDKELRNCINEYDNHLTEIKKKVDVVSRNMTLMIDSDKESIKSFIATQYYTAMEKKYIEVYIMETLEIRYKKYLQENGDTFVASLMQELRELPHKPPEDEDSTIL